MAYSHCHKVAHKIIETQRMSDCLEEKNAVINCKVHKSRIL